MFGKLLKLVRTVTAESCKICLAFAPTSQKGWNKDECIKENDFFLKHAGFFNYDNSNKRGTVDNNSNRIIILERKEIMKVAAENNPVLSTNEPLLYLRLAHYLYPKDPSSENRPIAKKIYNEDVKMHAMQLAPDMLDANIKKIDGKCVEEAISDSNINRKTYHSLCYALLKIILAEDKYRTTYIDPSQFENNTFGLACQKLNCIRPPEVPEGIAFVVQNKTKKLLFCYDDQDDNLLKIISSKVKEADKNRFDYVCVMVVRDVDEQKMKDRRRVSRADEWKRGFFISFPELGYKAEAINKKEYERLGVCTPRPAKSVLPTIKTVIAEVVNNIPVGKERDFASAGCIEHLTETIKSSPVGKEYHNHFKLRFKTVKSFNIIPGQFIMMATRTQEESSTDMVPKEWNQVISSFNTKPKAYLKRPFGIHRAFYPYFGEDYLKKLILPPKLSAIMHTVFPNEFEIFYKVLKDGVGTNELAKLEAGNKVQLIGPLGKRIDMRNIRVEGYEEIHVIGGGVGMAPLIFLVQALKYYSHTVKAFIGTANIGMLKYSDRVERGYDEKPKDAIIYINDLSDIGINQKDIYVSTNKHEKIDHVIPEQNQFEGLVTTQYEQYLKDTWSRKKTLAFACGPNGMMQALTKITEKHDIKLKVFMEKRMACGIGVCLSCVCKTKSGEGGYSRVCTDGPIFDASEIIW